MNIKTKELKGTQTEKNLQTAFEGECMARVKYGYFASKARKDGYEKLARVFEETSNQESEHAKIWCKFLDGISSTPENLEAAIAGELYEHTSMYKEFAKVARKEGFIEIAQKFEGVGAVEHEHEEVYKKYLSNIKAGTMFKKKKIIVWECLNCGHDHKGTEAPLICPVCAHPQSYFTPDE